VLHVSRSVRGPEGHRPLFVTALRGGPHHGRGHGRGRGGRPRAHTAGIRARHHQPIPE
jgi:hypothetical protein